MEPPEEKIDPAIAAKPANEETAEILTQKAIDERLNEHRLERLASRF